MLSLKQYPIREGVTTFPNFIREVGGRWVRDAGIVQFRKTPKDNGAVLEMDIQPEFWSMLRYLRIRSSELVIQIGIYMQRISENRFAGEPIHLEVAHYLCSEINRAFEDVEDVIGDDIRIPSDIRDYISSF